MNTHSPILVIGGTHGAGLLITRLLHRQGHHVHVLARDRERAMTLRSRMSRADVAQVFLAALEPPKANRATFEAVWGQRGRPEAPETLRDRVVPDEARNSLP